MSSSTPIGGGSLNRHYTAESVNIFQNNVRDYLDKKNDSFEVLVNFLVKDRNLLQQFRANLTQMGLKTAEQILISKLMNNVEELAQYRDLTNLPPEEIGKIRKYIKDNDVPEALVKLIITDQNKCRRIFLTIQTANVGSSSIKSTSPTSSPKKERHVTFADKVSTRVIKPLTLQELYAKFTLQRTDLIKNEKPLEFESNKAIFNSIMKGLDLNDAISLLKQLQTYAKSSSEAAQELAKEELRNTISSLVKGVLKEESPRHGDIVEYNKFQEMIKGKITGIVNLFMEEAQTYHKGKYK